MRIVYIIVALIKEQEEDRTVEKVTWINQQMIADILTKSGSPLVETVHLILSSGLMINLKSENESSGHKNKVPLPELL